MLQSSPITVMANSLKSVLTHESSFEVSTELTLFDQSWVGYSHIPNPKRRKLNSCDSSVASNIGAMRVYSKEILEEEERLGVSTRLKLYEDPNEIRKKLTTSDLNSLCRLSSFEVSTELTLFDQSWVGYSHIPNPKRRKLNSCDSSVASNIGAMRVYSKKILEEEERLGVSTRLKLYEDPYKIRKKLTASDLNSLCRLLVGGKLIAKYVLPLMNEEMIKEVESRMGMSAAIWDDDTKTRHELSFKHWSTSKSYVFNDNWRESFVRRRDLKKDDEIGLYWNPYESMFSFCVIKRA